MNKTYWDKPDDETSDPITVKTYKWTAYLTSKVKKSSTKYYLSFSEDTIGTKITPGNIVNDFLGLFGIESAKKNGRFELKNKYIDKWLKKYHKPSISDDFWQKVEPPDDTEVLQEGRYIPILDRKRTEMGPKLFFPLQTNIDKYKKALEHRWYSLYWSFNVGDEINFNLEVKGTGYQDTHQTKYIFNDIYQLR